MPYLGSTIFIATIACLVLLSVLGSILLASACFGRFVERSALAASGRPLRSLAIGLPLLAGGLFSSAALLQGGGPLAKLLGTLVATSLTAACIVALASIALHVGSSLSSNAQESPLFRRVMRGALVVELAAMLPIFGWFVVLPLAVATGLGAAARTLLSRAPRPSHAWPPGPAAPGWPQPRSEVPASEAYATRG
jgi:hypothetical protein